MSKYTKGPWIVSDTRDGSYPGIMSGVERVDGRIVNAQQVYPFYDCDHTTETFRRHDADKRLIEAAPELLELLEDSLPAVEECEQFNKPSCRELSKKIRKLLNTIHGGGW